MSAQTTSSVFLWQETSKLLEETEEFANVESLVREHARFVFKVAYGVLRNSHDAEDVVQEVFLRVHHLGTKDVRHLRSWLARVAFRLAIDHQRKPGALDLASLELPADEPGTEEVAIHRQRVECVQKLIAALPDDLRYPLVLSAIEELSSRQISDMLGISESSVRGRIFRARQILKEKLVALTNRSNELQRRIGSRSRGRAG